MKSSSIDQSVSNSGRFRRLLKLAFFLGAGLLGACLSLYAEPIGTYESFAFNPEAFDSNIGPLSISWSSPFVSTSVLAGNMALWYSPFTLPTQSAGTPQQILLANISGTVQPSGSGLDDFDPEYISTLENEIVSGAWYRFSIPGIPAISVASAGSRSGVTSDAIVRPLAAVPEPGTLVLLGSSLVAFGAVLVNRAGQSLGKPEEVQAPETPWLVL